MSQADRHHIRIGLKSYVAIDCSTYRCLIPIIHWFIAIKYIALNHLELIYFDNGAISRAIKFQKNDPLCRRLENDILLTVNLILYCFFRHSPFSPWKGDKPEPDPGGWRMGVAMGRTQGWQQSALLHRPDQKGSRHKVHASHWLRDRCRRGLLYE